MGNRLLLEIATPEKELLRQEVDEVQVPTTNGYIGILPDHAPLLAQVGTGVLRYLADGTRKVIAVNGGYVEVRENLVRVLADTAETPEEIDLKRAKAAQRRAQERLTSGDPQIDYERARAALARALARLSAVEEAGQESNT